MRPLLFTNVFIVSLFCCAVTIQGQIAIQADQELQSLISEWAATANRDKGDTYFTLLAKIEPLARRDYPHFAKQVMYYVQNLKGEERQRGAFVYRLFVFLLVPESEIARGLGRYLYAEDEELRESVRRIFPFDFFTDAVGFYNYPDYSKWGDLVKEGSAKAEFLEPLKRMMFEFAPNAAFLFYHTDAPADELIDLRRNERVIANALYQKNLLEGFSGGRTDAATTAAVHELCNSKYWWARLFVSEVMVQNKEFRDAGLIVKLKTDENELVRKSIASLEKPDLLRATPVD